MILGNVSNISFPLLFLVMEIFDVNEQMGSFFLFYNAIQQQLSENSCFFRRVGI